MSDSLLEDVDLFLPPDYIRGAVKDIIFYTLIISLYHGFFWKIFSANFPDKDFATISYRWVNLSVNLGFSVVGTYYWFFLLETLNGWERIMAPTSLAFFANWQLAYQIWSITVGLIFVNESPIMIFHHIFVIATAFSSSFLTMGMRYESVYFFGVTESSSIFLAIMNFFKDSPDLQNQYPRMYSIVRQLFSVTFLLVRVVIFLPNICDYFGDLASAASVSKGIASIFVYMGIISGVALTFMQVYWAWLIVKAFLKIYLKKEKGGKYD